jgi:hypothetical protein
MRNGLKALLLCATVAIAWSNTGVVAAPVNRAFGAGKYAVELDGVNAGWVSAVEGGMPFGDVVD